MLYFPGINFSAWGVGNYISQARKISLFLSVSSPGRIFQWATADGVSLSVCEVISADFGAVQITTDFSVQANPHSILTYPRRKRRKEVQNSVIETCSESKSICLAISCIEKGLESIAWSPLAMVQKSWKKRAQRLFASESLGSLVAGPRKEEVWLRPSRVTRTDEVDDTFASP